MIMIVMITKIKVDKLVHYNLSVFNDGDYLPHLSLVIIQHKHTGTNVADGGD